MTGRQGSGFRYCPGIGTQDEAADNPSHVTGSEEWSGPTVARSHEAAGASSRGATSGGIPNPLACWKLGLSGS